MAAKRVLLIVTTHTELGHTKEATGFWFEELAAPYFTFADAGIEVDIGSIKGGPASADPKSLDESPVVARFVADKVAAKKLANTIPLAKISPTEYDAYFVVGGHGVMWDLAIDPVAIALLGNAFDGGRVVSAVCHGPAALVNVKLKDGSSIVAGRRVAGFTDEEERAAHLDATVPFLLQSKLIALGGRYERGPMWKAFAVRDGRLVTGQNPASSVVTAQETIAALQ